MVLLNWVSASTSIGAMMDKQASLLGLVVDTKSIKLIDDDSCMVDVVVFMHGNCTDVSPGSIISFKFLNRHLSGRVHGSS